MVSVCCAAAGSEAEGPPSLYGLCVLQLGLKQRVHRLSMVSVCCAPAGSEAEGPPSLYGLCVLQLGLKQRVHRLSMVSVCDAPHTVSVESNSVELLTEPFLPFSFFNFFSMWPRSVNTCLRPVSDMSQTCLRHVSDMSQTCLSLV